MKTLRCLNLLQRCTVKTIYGQSSGKFTHQCTASLLRRNLFTASFQLKDFHPYYSSYNYQEETSKKTTYADLSPITVNSDLLKLLSIAIPNEQKSTLVSSLSNQDIAFRRSDNFWNSSQWFSSKENLKMNESVFDTCKLLILI